MASTYEKTVERMLFDYGTTNRTDYRGGAIESPIATTFKPKPTCQRLRPPHLRDIHTLSDWRTAPIPFSIFHKPKEIVRTDPGRLQKAYSKILDPDREEAQRTRPRLVMTPAVSMDDITDPRARSILIEDMYTSVTTRGAREAVSVRVAVKAPLPTLPAPSNPVVLRKLQPPFVSPEWRMDSAAWDGRQVRGHGDATRHFWLKKELPRCRACDEHNTVKVHRKMQCQMVKRR